MSSCNFYRWSQSKQPIVHFLHKVLRWQEFMTMPSTAYQVCHQAQFWRVTFIDKLSLRSILELCCLRPRKQCKTYQWPSEHPSLLTPLWSRYLYPMLATTKRKRISRHLHHLEPFIIWKRSINVRQDKNWTSCKCTSQTKRALIASSKLPSLHVHQSFRNSTAARQQASNLLPPNSHTNKVARRQEAQTTRTPCSTKSATSAVRRLADLTKFLSAWSVTPSGPSFPKFSSTSTCTRGTNKRKLPWSRRRPQKKTATATTTCLRLRRVSWLRDGLLLWLTTQQQQSKRNHSSCRAWGTYLLEKQWLKNFEAKM